MTPSLQNNALIASFEATYEKFYETDSIETANARTQRILDANYEIVDLDEYC